MLTTTPDVAMRKWEERRPTGTQPTRLQSVEFTDAAKACIVRMIDEAGAKSTCKQIACRLNDPNSIGYRFPGSREYKRTDVQRELNKLFPPAMDVAQTFAYLKELQITPGWEGLGVEIGKSFVFVCVHAFR